MSFRRTISFLALILAFGGTGAIAIAQSQSSGGNSEEAESSTPGPHRESSDAFLRTARHYEKTVPSGIPRGPRIRPDEVHIPVGLPVEFFVEHCTASATKDPSLDSDPLCRAVLLMDAKAIPAGVFHDSEVERRYQALIAGQ